jgi:TM2 domain-containing membrane protein YozV
MRLSLVALLLVAASVTAHAADTARTEDRAAVFAMSRSPLTATLLSAVAPGSGQIYNGQWWKAPVVWALGGLLLYKVIGDNNRYLDAQDAYFNSTDSTIRRSQAYFSLKEQFRDDRDYYGAFLFLLYALNVADAYVGAHLFDFPVEHGMVQSVSLRPWSDRSATLGVPLGVSLNLHLR